MNSQRHVVKEGDCLWNLADRFLGSPWQWHRIWTYNNRESIVRQTGRGIVNPDLIYVGQVLYIPMLPKQPKPPPKKNPRIQKPKSLKNTISKTKMPFATAYKLEDLPVMVYEDTFVKATIKLAGDIVIRLADTVPIIHATNRGLETTYCRQTEDVVRQLFLDQAAVEWDSVSKTITYRCLLVANSSTPGSPSTAVGLAIASDRPAPVLRGEIRFPELSGYINGHFYAAKNVQVVIEVEPKAPPVARDPKVMNPDLVFKEKATIQKNSGYAGAWKLIGDGALLLTATILTDFLFGIGLFDDVVTIPAALSMMGYGLSRVIYPMAVRSTGALAAQQVVYHGARMTLKAAH